jgi:hypothetical protein
MCIVQLRISYNSGGQSMTGTISHNTKSAMLAVNMFFKSGIVCAPSSDVPKTPS